MKTVKTCPKGKVRSIKSRAGLGFTLIETLVATAILALLGTMIAAGIPTAVKVMEDSSFSADSSLLESTVDTALADTFRYATDIHLSSDAIDPQWRFNTADGKHSNVYLAASEGYLFFVDTKAGTESLSVLVTKGAYSKLGIEDFSYTYDPSTQTFSGEYTIILPDNLAKTRDVSFAYKALYANTESP